MQLGVNELFFSSERAREIEYAYVYAHEKNFECMIIAKYIHWLDKGNVVLGHRRGRLSIWWKKELTSHYQLVVEYKHCPMSGAPCPSETRVRCEASQYSKMQTYACVGLLANNLAATSYCRNTARPWAWVLKVINNNSIPYLRTRQRRQGLSSWPSTFYAPLCAVAGVWRHLYECVYEIENGKEKPWSCISGHSAGIPYIDQ